jgi:hypothetical protein
VLVGKPRPDGSIVGTNLHELAHVAILRFLLVVVDFLLVAIHAFSLGVHGHDFARVRLGDGLEHELGQLAGTPEVMFEDFELEHTAALPCLIAICDEVDSLFPTPFCVTADFTSGRVWFVGVGATIPCRTHLDERVFNPIEQICGPYVSDMLFESSYLECDHVVLSIPAIPCHQSSIYYG